MSVQSKNYILKRERIGSELNNIFYYPLTVVVAAMGYGKTTAAKSFLDEKNIQYVWLTVESEETSAPYLWDSLTRQWARTDPQLGKQLNKLGFPADAPQREKIVALLEDHAYVKSTVLVIDDYHLARSSALDDFLERIVRDRIQGLRMVILSRTSPALNLEDLRLKGYCYQVQSELFEMSQGEISEFFKLFDRRIDNVTAEQVLRIYEGWITAVYLIMQRYSKIGRLEPGYNIETLLETAVMSRYTDTEARLLKFLSILENFTLPQAVHVTGEPAAAKILQGISAGNSLIRFDEHSDTYRLHNIFSSYLQKKLAEELGDKGIRKLFKRAGQWHLANGELLAGLGFLLRAKEYDLI